MSKIKFKINGKEYEVDGKFGPDVSLNEFIRNVADLRGTKAMCHEGGCGACVVAARAALPPNNVVKTFAVNSCLVSVLSCHGWEVTTVEGVGNRIKGYHDIQTRLAKFNGTQCGYCTPGWVMNMYSLYESKDKNLSSVEVENSFASNMCRCTGYRPIADAFKSFAKDADQKLLDKLGDLEDLAMFKTCGLECAQKCSHRDKCFKGVANSGDGDKEVEYILISDESMIVVDAGKHKWYKAYNLSDVFKAMSFGEYKLIAGNTGQGVYHVTDYPPHVIDIFNVAEIKGHIIDVNLILGAGMPLTEMMELFMELASQKEEFSYLKQFYDHMDLVAHIPVRNIGTIGGNLFLKHINNDFQSDLFLLFETVGAMITVVGSGNKEEKFKLPEFLKAPMKGKIIKNIMLPPLSHCCSVKTYKIMPRSQNAHAVVNAGFMFKFKQNSEILEKATIVYGSISPTFVHAAKTEEVLVGKDPYTDETLQLALKTLDEEINPEEAPPEPSAAYRKKLAVALYYKAILSLCPSNKMNSYYKSGGEAIKRHKSKGMQSYETDKTLWPLNQPVPKIEALVQCSGEAVFANDLPTQANEVFAAFVTADVNAGSIIKDFDTTEAFKLPGVTAFYTAADIPGDNIFTPANIPFMFDQEEILCAKQVKFYGQPAAIIVADREKTANKAAKLVKIQYVTVSKNRPLLNIDEVLKSPEKSKRVRSDQILEPTETGNDVKTVITGQIKMEEQYHYYMEPQTCVVRPTEDGMEVFSSTQWLDLTNVAIAQSLKIPVNSINVQVRRVGGAYGGKISRSTQIACSAALVTHLTNKTCRMILPLQTNMGSIGKRIPLNSSFEVGVNAEGEIQYLKNTFYQDSGCYYNETLTFLTLLHSHNCYNWKRWYGSANSVLTDKPSNTWCRAPFTTEGIAVTEYIMEKIAFSLHRDPVEVRLKNMDFENNPIPDMINQIKKDANFDERSQQVQEFNRVNRWRKRAIKLIPMTVDIQYTGNFNAIVSVYHADGTVVVTHGGVEMGQGINTKVAQVCAYKLGIPLEKVSVKPSTSFTSPNAIVTGGSIGSECVVFAAMKACETINERLQPLREKLENPSWEVLVANAYGAGIDLQALHTFSKENDAKPYEVYGVGILELEVDILTGNHDVIRVDILEDTGRSLSPEIDVAQIEGAFIMGLGYWTSEKVIYDGSSGKLLTDRTWTYKIPGIKDIPSDMRIYFRRNGRNESGVLQSKATGEPAFCLATVFIHAVHEAVRAARLDAGHDDVWFDIDNPCTVENIFMAAEHKLEHFKLK
ncbi:xanthine dehydrogenase 1-like isoform X2 [Trichoplusia ni]|uniref:Indole-3-acetaldehyde oxidase n=1 Tax=Trichoplusia ni TaxID=7111 RepID=A0A7E5WMU9_TRINI|nr:xanthine dehydrogenase 1-like isoform X2 [Trichoplusia ni]